MAVEDDASPCRYGYDYQRRQLDREQDKIRRLIQEAQKDTSEPSISPRGSEDNPFIVFRRFVDAQFDTLSEGLRSIPSGLTDMRAKLQERREQRIQRELESWRRWTGHTGSSDEASTPAPTEEDREQAVFDAVTIVSRARDINGHVPRDKINALFKLDHQTAFFGPKGVVSLIGTAGSTGGGGSFAFDYVSEPHRWLSVDWFKRSPYSPTQLEARHEDKNWRAAFEDLLNATLGKKMTSREQFGMRSINASPLSTFNCAGVDWMLSLQCRGILPPQLPTLYSSQPGVALKDDMVLRKVVSKDEYPIETWHDAQVGREFHEIVDEIMKPAPSKAEVAAPETELDMYKHFLGPPRMFGDAEEDWEYTVSRACPANAMGYQNTTERPLQVYEDMLGKIEERFLQALEEAHGEIEEPTLSGDKWEDYMLAVRAADRADRRSDTEAAGRYMDQYYRMHEGLDEQEDEGRKNLSGLCPDDLGRSVQQTVREMDEEEEQMETESRWEKLYSNLWPKSRDVGHEENTRQEELESLVEEIQASAQPRFERLYGSRKQVMKKSTPADAERAQGRSEDACVKERGQRSTPSARRYLFDHQNGTASFVDPRAEREAGAPAQEDRATRTEQPSILSSLTTTQQTVMPDGSITTKVVLRQRFADGREEMSESVHTSNEANQAVGEKRAEQKKKGGWFWS